LKLTPVQSRTMFSLWGVMSAPLLIGSNIIDLTQWDLETYSNMDIIAVDQDTLGLQGQRIVGENLNNDRNLIFAKLDNCNENDPLQTWEYMANGVLINKKLNLCLSKDIQSSYIIYEECSFKDIRMIASNNIFSIKDNDRIMHLFNEECVTLLPDGEMVSLQRCDITSNFMTQKKINNNKISIGFNDKCLTATKEVTAPSLFNIWARPLSNGAYAVHFINNDAKKASITCDVNNCFKKMNYPQSGQIIIKDLWHKNYKSFRLGHPFTTDVLDQTGGSATYTFFGPMN